MRMERPKLGLSTTLDLGDPALAAAGGEGYLFLAHLELLAALADHFAEGDLRVWALRHRREPSAFRQGFAIGSSIFRSHVTGVTPSDGGRHEHGPHDRGAATRAAHPARAAVCEAAPGPGPDRDAVASNQRSRLIGAMIEEVAERGYAATTLARLVGLAGVSKRAFHELFRTKEAYFLATYDAIVANAMRRIGAAYRCEGDWQARLRAGFAAYAAEVVDEPKAARLVLVEVLGAGPAALARMRRTRLIFEQVVSAELQRGSRRHDAAAADRQGDRVRGGANHAPAAARRRR